jgi:hypothetical protein
MPEAYNNNFIYIYFTMNHFSWTEQKILNGATISGKAFSTEYCQFNAQFHEIKKVTKLLGVSKSLLKFIICELLFPENIQFNTPFCLVADNYNSLIYIDLNSDFNLKNSNIGYK